MLVVEAQVGRFGLQCVPAVVGLPWGTFRSRALGRPPEETGDRIARREEIRRLFDRGGRVWG